VSLTFSLSYGALWLVAILQGLLIVVLLYQLAKLQQTAESGNISVRSQLPIGSSSPNIRSINSEQVRQNISELSDVAHIVLFLSVGCPSCGELVESMGEDDGKQMPPTLVICHGGIIGCDKFERSLDSAIPILTDDTGDIAERFGISASPTAVVLDANQKIRAYGHPRNREEIRTLFSQAVTLEVSEEAVPAGSQAAVLN